MIDHDKRLVGRWLLEGDDDDDEGVADCRQASMDGYVSCSMIRG